MPRSGIEPVRLTSAAPHGPKAPVRFRRGRGAFGQAEDRASIVIKTYFQDELRYLREVGPDFARANPEIARLLTDRGSDPDVDRLLEGVAFLCARIRQKLDDELPEVTSGLLSLLWPHYLRPIPSMSILEFLPEVEAMQSPLRVPAGAAFASIPVDGTQCRYRSCWPTVLRPWGIDDARLEATAGAPAKLVLRFRTSSKAALENLELGHVRLYLAGDPRTCFTLYLLLAAHVGEVRVSDGGTGGKRREMALSAKAVRAAGLDRNEAVLPYPQLSFPGYRLLQEYFAFKERFLFVDVHGLDRAVRELELTNVLELSMTFNRRLDSFPLVSPENVRLHCVPIINLFEHSADPIRVQHERVQNLLMPSKSGVADRRHLEVFSVDRVAGVVKGEGVEAREFEPFHSFHHLAASDPSRISYYQSHLVPNVHSGDPRLGTDMYLSFVCAGEGGGLPADTTISVELTCTNRHLPGSLRAGDICEPTDSSPAGTRFRNILKPSPTISPPLGRGMQWRLISHLSLNYVSLISAGHLKELLRLYDFESEHDAHRALAQQRMLEGILRVDSTFRQRIIRGAAVRGVQVDMELNDDHFAGEGDAYLFASILDHFLALYTTINAFSELSVRSSRTGQVYSFPPRWGEQPTPAGAVNGGVS